MLTSYNPVVQSALRICIHGFYIQGLHILRISWLWTENSISDLQVGIQGCRGLTAYIFVFVAQEKTDFIFRCLEMVCTHVVHHFTWGIWASADCGVCEGSGTNSLQIRGTTVLLNFGVCLFVKFCLNLAPRKFFLLLSFVWLSLELRKAVGLYKS